MLSKEDQEEIKRYIKQTEESLNYFYGLSQEKAIIYVSGRISAYQEILTTFGRNRNTKEN